MKVKRWLVHIKGGITVIRAELLIEAPTYERAKTLADEYARRLGLTCEVDSIQEM